MKKLLRILFYFLFSLLFIWMSFNTLTFFSKQIQITTTPPLQVSEQAQQKLSAAIKIPTFSKPFEAIAATKIYQFIQDAFPHLHQNPHISYQTINQYSLLYKWEGRNEAIPPILILTNYDVIDPELQYIPEWTYNPFVGKIENSRIWGRGTQTSKGQMVAAFEALELLSKQDFKPERTLYFFVGHDSENGGHNGAKALAAILKKHQLQFELILGGGTYLTTPQTFPLKDTTAFIGISQKNEVEIQLKAHGKQSTTVLTSGIKRLEAFQWNIPIQTPITTEIIQHWAPETALTNKFLYANTSILGSIAAWDLKTKPFLGSLLSSMVYCETIKEQNGTASASIKLKLHPDYSLQEAFDQIQQTLADTSIKIILPEYAHNHIYKTPPSGYSYNILQTSIQQVFGNLIVLPTIVPHQNDLYYFKGLSKDILAFSPLVCNDCWQTNDIIDESIKIRDYHKMVNFYYQFLQNTLH